MRAEATQDFIASVLEDAKKITGLIGQKKKLSSAKLVLASKAKKSFMKKLVEEGRASEKALMPVVEDELTKKYLEKTFFDLFARPQFLEIDEEKVLKNSRSFLEKELGLAVEIEMEEDSKEEKASRAMPLKPAIILC